MQPVTQEWKTAQRQTLVPESFVKITMKVGDPDAQGDASLSDNGHAYIARIEDVLAGTAAPIKYATLEPSLWALDGTFRIVGGSGVKPPPLAGQEAFVPAGDISTLLTADQEEFFCTVM